MKSLKSIAAALSLLLVGASPASAAEVRSSTLVPGVQLSWLRISKNNAFAVIIDDEVKDGCWTAASSTRTAVTLELARSGYQVSELNDGPIILYMKAMGREVYPGLCAVSYSSYPMTPAVEKFYRDEHEVLSVAQSLTWLRGGLIPGEKKHHHRRKGSVVNSVQDFLVRIPTRQSSAITIIRERANTPEASRYWTSYTAE